MPQTFKAAFPSFSALKHDLFHLYYHALLKKNLPSFHNYSDYYFFLKKCTIQISRAELFNKLLLLNTIGHFIMQSYAELFLSRVAKSNHCTGRGGAFWQWGRVLQHADLMWKWSQYVRDVVQELSSVGAKLNGKISLKPRLKALPCDITSVLASLLCDACTSRLGAGFPSTSQLVRCEQELKKLGDSPTPTGE